MENDILINVHVVVDSASPIRGKLESVIHADAAVGEAHVDEVPADFQPIVSAENGKHVIVRSAAVIGGGLEIVILDNADTIFAACNLGAIKSHLDHG